MMARSPQPRLRLVVGGSTTSEPTKSTSSGRIEADDPRVAAAADGDRSALEALACQLLPRVRNLVRYLVKGDGDVDDLAHEALMAVLKALPSFQGHSAFTTWSDRITVRETLHRVRKMRTERQRRTSMAPDLRQQSTPPPPPDSYAVRRQMAEALDQVPEAQREVVVLHHVVGMSIPELAQELEIPFDTAKSRLRLGMQKLRQQFEHTVGSAPSDVR